MYAMTRILAVSAACALCGCGPASDGFEFGPVSGMVTMEGAPLPEATVVFVPMGEGLNTGRPSFGKTDASGAFELTATNGLDGAVIGPHVVSISTGVINENTGEVIVPEVVPKRFNRRSTLEFVVPPEGTSDANFDLKSK